MRPMARFTPATPLFPSIGPATSAALFAGIGGAPPAAPQATAWAAELETILEQRLAGLALLALEGAQAEGAQAPAPVLDALRRAHLAQSAATLAAEAAAPAVAGALREAGVEAVLTKGPGIARHYPRADLRPYFDLDLLVAPPSFPRAMRALEAAGFGVPPERMPARAFFLRRCREAVNLLGPQNANVDLHHHVPPWSWGARMRFDAVARAAAPLKVGRTEFLAASATDNFLVACLHVLSDRGRPGRTLMIWRDIATLARAEEPARIAARAKEFGLEGIVGMVAAALPPGARPDALMDALGGAGLRAGERARLRMLLPPGIGSRHEIGQAIRLPLANGVAFVAGTLFPSRAFLRNRYGTERAYRRWLSDVTGRFGSARRPE
jgi:hypothetical protein